MPSTTTPVGAVDVATLPRQAPQHSRPPLSVVHATALYKPVPPLDCDDDGHPYLDSSAVESTDHWDLRAYLVQVMRSRYASRDDVFAAADLGFYFERGNRSAGLEVLPHDRELRLRDPESGETLPDWSESVAKRRSEAARAHKEAAKRKAAERRIAELEARLRLT